MPCYQTGSALGDANLAADEARQELTRVTRLLCKMCRAASIKCPQFQWPPDVLEWYREHQRVDAKRKRSEAEERRQERLAAKAKSKLSAEERRALGL